MSTGPFSPLDTALSTFEGFGDSINAPTITFGNNPGAIQYGNTAMSFGSSGAGPNGAALFDTLDEGLNALHSVESNIIAQGNNTPDSFVTAYEGGVPNSNYSSFIADQLGIGTGDPFPSTATAPASPASTNQPTAAQTTNAAQPSGGFMSTLGSLFSHLPSPLNGVSGAVSAGQGAVSAVGSAVNALSWWQSLSFAQIAAFIIGAGLIIGGVFFLRPVQQVVGKVTKAVSG